MLAIRCCAWFTGPAHPPILSHSFRYSSELRSSTQGKGEFTMEFNKYSPVLAGEQAEIIKAYQQSLKDKKK